MKMILASASPRRKELLEQIGFSFQVKVSTGEEKITEKDPGKAVEELALQKALQVREQRKKERPEERAKEEGMEIVIGADTVVVYEGQILGKPKSRENAVRMLTMLQGKTHEVYTGVAICTEEDDGKGKTFHEKSKVTFYPMTQEEIQWYVDSEEPMDKAGAYGIQGLGARYIERIEGDYNTVVGLPVGRLYQELQAMTDHCAREQKRG